jgi:hypothetical protein
MTPPGPASPFVPEPAKPGELSDVQRKSIYRALASYERFTEVSEKQAAGLEQAGQREAAANLRKNRDEQRKRMVQNFATANQISEAQVEEIYQQGKREKW